MDRRLAALRRDILAGDHEHLDYYLDGLARYGTPCNCENVDCAAHGGGKHVFPASSGMLSPGEFERQVKACHEQNPRLAHHAYWLPDCTCPNEFQKSPGICINVAGDANLQYVGGVCDSCATHMPEEYHLEDCGCPVCVNPESLPEVHEKGCECDQCLIAANLTDDPDVFADTWDENDPMQKDIDEFPEQEYDEDDGPDRMDSFADPRPYYGDEEYWEDEEPEEEEDDWEEEYEEDESGWMG